MTTMARSKKWITTVVLLAFIWLAARANAPLRAAGENDDKSPAAVEKISRDEPLTGKKSILPALLIAAGAITALAAVYFLVIRKNSETLHDDFDGAADPLWRPRTASAWSVTDGRYICRKEAGGADTTKWWEWSLYDRSWSKPAFTITVRMRITDAMGPYGLLLASDPGMEAVNGFQIMFYGDDRFFIRKVDGWNYKDPVSTDFTWIRNWTPSPAIIPGLNQWNTFTLVRNGFAYKLIVNDTLVLSFVDSGCDPRYVAIAVLAQTFPKHLEVDRFYVDVN
jgi:hypothetical protein